MHLTSLPAKVVKTPEAVFVIRGLTKIKFSNKKLYEPIDTIIACLSKNPITEKDLLASFSKDLHCELIQAVEVLVKNNIISYIQLNDECQINEKNKIEDIFYWHFQTNSKEVKKRLNEITLAVVGINEFSTCLLKMLQKTGFSQYFLISDPILNEYPLAYQVENQNNIAVTNWLDISKNINCIVAIASLNQKQALINWGRISTSLGAYFYPILVNNLRVYLGPYIMPGHTPCYNCVIQRMASNIVPYYPQAVDSIVENSFFYQDINGYHPCMVDATASFATMDIMNQICNLTTSVRNSITDLCLIKQEALNVKVLRSPGCLVCKGN